MSSPIAGLGLRLGGRAISNGLPTGGALALVASRSDIKATAKQLKRVGEGNVPLAIAQHQPLGVIVRHGALLGQAGFAETYPPNLECNG